MAEGLEIVDQVRAARATLAALEGDGGHLDAVLAECAADPHGDGVGRLSVAVIAQCAELARLAFGADAERFFLQVLEAGTEPGEGSS